MDTKIRTSTEPQNHKEQLRNSIYHETTAAAATHACTHTHTNTHTNTQEFIYPYMHAHTQGMTVLLADKFKECMNKNPQHI